MGLEFARQLAAKGYDLLLVSNREEELDSAKAQLTANVADPGVVASGMIDLGHWFDPLADTKRPNWTGNSGRRRNC